MKSSNKIIEDVIIRIRRETSAADVAERIGTLDTAAYLGLKSDWKADYAALSREIREAKVEMRQPGDRSIWQAKREFLRFNAFRMMTLRAAIKEMGQRHWAERKAALAA